MDEPREETPEEFRERMRSIGLIGGAARKEPEPPQEIIASGGLTIKKPGAGSGE
jgi:hypothetical protein